MASSCDIYFLREEISTVYAVSMIENHMQIYLYASEKRSRVWRVILVSVVPTSLVVFQMSWNESMGKPRCWLWACAVIAGLVTYVAISHTEILPYSALQSHLMKHFDMKWSYLMWYNRTDGDLKLRRINQTTTDMSQMLGVTTDYLRSTAEDSVSTRIENITTRAENIFRLIINGTDNNDTINSKANKYITINNNANILTVKDLKHNHDRDLPKVYCSCPGRIGNCLFVIATAYAVAHKTNRTPMLSENFKYLNKTFNNLEHLNSLGFFKKPNDTYATVGEHRFAKYTPSVFTKVPANKSVALSGYFQSYKYFHDLEAEIIELFTFAPSLIKDADKRIYVICKEYLKINKNMSVSQLTFVGIHIRQGDYGSARNVKLGYKRATVDYLHKARYYFTLRYSPVVFIVLSDTPEWGKRYVVGDNVFHPAKSSGEHDLALLSRCNHTITSVGSYSWWAGYLAGGEVTYYHEPYNISIGVGTGFVAEDFFPPSWIPISNMTDAEIEARARNHKSWRWQLDWQIDELLSFRGYWPSSLSTRVRTKSLTLTMA